MGINSSGVREIAEARSSGDEVRVSRTALALRRVALVLGAGGALGLVALSQPIAYVSFGDTSYWVSICLLGGAVFCGTISAGQTALIQGMRRVRDLALLSIIGALFGTCLSIPLVFWFRERGIAAYLLGVAVAGVGASWWYARKISIKPVPLRWGEALRESSGLLKLGFAFMISGLLSVGAAYLIRVLILRTLGDDAAGFYQAAWTLAGLYVGTVLQAMGADFFPRLTASAQDHSECNRLVNEQSEIALLLAVPGILASITLAPLVIALFYSAKFGPSVELLRWNCLGMLLRIIAWPIGYIIMAKGARRMFLFTEVTGSLLYVGLVIVGSHFFGLRGTGMAFAGMYLPYVVLVFFAARKLTGFAFSPAVKRMLWWFIPAVFGVFALPYFLPESLVLIAGLLITIIVSWLSLRTLVQLVPINRLPGPIQKVIALTGVAPNSSQ
jgi:PST family polysaccharide transporter